MIDIKNTPACAFSGHRNLRKYDFEYSELHEAIYDLLQAGIRRFYCGMAQGFDLEAAECLLSFKGQFDFELTAVIPCANQSDTFSRENKGRYKKILGACSDEIVLNDRYFQGCMLQRNRYMVDSSEVLLCFLRERSGGTFYTYNYAKKLKRIVIEL